MTRPRLNAAAALSPRRGRLFFALALAVAAAALLAANLDGGPAAALQSLVAPAHSRELTATHSLAQKSDDGSLPEIYREVRAADSGDDAKPIAAATTWPAP